MKVTIEIRTVYDVEVDNARSYEDAITKVLRTNSSELLDLESRPLDGMSSRFVGREVYEVPAGQDQAPSRDRLRLQDLERQLETLARYGNADNLRDVAAKLLAEVRKP